MIEYLQMEPPLGKSDHVGLLFVFLCYTYKNHSDITKFCGIKVKIMA